MNTTTTDRTIKRHTPAEGALEEFAQKPEDAARHHSCAFCPSPILASAEDLRWAGWRRRGGYWVCPDCIGEALA